MHRGSSASEKGHRGASKKREMQAQPIAARNAGLFPFFDWAFRKKKDLLDGACDKKDPPRNGGLRSIRPSAQVGAKITLSLLHRPVSFLFSTGDTGKEKGLAGRSLSSGRSWR
jgi:hypothetical protein